MGDRPAHPVYQHLEALKKLRPEERAELHRLLGTYAQRWLTLPGPQDQAYHSKADILFYGGAAGGAKSDLLLGLARNEHQRSIIFRRNYGQLSGIIERAFDVLPAKLNSKRMIYRLGGGRTIELGAVQHEHDWKNFAGRPHDFIAFDELPQFQQSQFRALIGWLRHPDPRQRKRVVATGNPPTDAEGDWVTRYWGPWLNPGDPLFGRVKPGDLVWYTTIEGEDIVCENGDPFMHKGKLVTPMSRTFIPSRLRDNPYLMLSGYEAVLQGMPEPLRSQMLDGDFMAGKADNPRQVIPGAWVEMAFERWRKTPKPVDVPVTALGVDVARGGPDNTVLSPRRGWWYDEQVVVPGRDTPDGDSVAILCSFHVEPSTQINVDVNGVGAAAVDSLRRVRPEDTVWPLMVSLATDEMDATGNFYFKNMRSLLTWRFRELLDPGLGSTMCLPPDPSLKADLCAPLWKPVGKFIEVEPKDKVKKRIGRSPDRGDSAIYAAVYHHTQVAVALGGAFR